MGDRRNQAWEITQDLASRIRAVARLRRRDRLIVELVCIDWELSHFDVKRRCFIEAHLSRAFAVTAFGKLLEDSVLGHVTGHEWTRLFRHLGM
jgi:hypothetical protein